jgi:hypothetical protein
MVRIAIGQAAFGAIASTMALGTILLAAPACERVKESIFSLESGHRGPSWMNGRHHG